MLPSSYSRIECSYAELCLDSLIRPSGIKNGKLDSIDELILAIGFIESSSNPNAVGDTHLPEPSVGYLQIRPIMVRDVNRILKDRGEDLRYSMKDRRDSTKSTEMFKIWCNAYHQTSSFEQIARCWNGGPEGHVKSATKKYWDKIERYAQSHL